MFVVEPGTTVYDQFSAYEDDGVTKRSGLTLGAGDFVVTTYKDCVITALPVSVTEIGATGEYCLDYTPPSTGFWHVDVFVVFNQDCYNSKASVGVSADLSTVADLLDRVLGLLHMNSIVDKQEFNDPNNQLTAWRLRHFNNASNTPVVPGGNEATGLRHEYEFEAEYNGPNQPKRLTVKKVL